MRTMIYQNTSKVYKVILATMLMSLSSLQHNYETFSAGLFHTCAIDRRTDSVEGAGPVKCWGQNQLGESTPPKGNFIQVSSGHSFTCGIRENKSIACWGQIEPKEHSGKFIHISSGNFHACALQVSGELTCFGRNDFKESMTPYGPFEQVSCGLQHTCALRKNGSVLCWGRNNVGQSNPPNYVSFKQISLGFKGHACGLDREKGNVVCWGDNSHGQSESRDGQFLDVSAGFRSTCAIRMDDNKIECWGLATKSKKYVSDDTFKSVNISLGQDHGCAVSIVGEIECWGSVIGMSTQAHVVPFEFKKRVNDEL